MMQTVADFVISSTSAGLQHIQILHNGPWATMASLSFLTAALMGGDLLALRAALLMAYVFNLINGLLGVPTWPYVDWEGRLNVDMVFWAAAAGFLHGYSVLRMLLDEMPVKFSSDDDEQLVRFFNRRSGMERLEGREVLKRGTWLQVTAGQRIADSAELHEHVYLLVEGRCSLLQFKAHEPQQDQQQALPSRGTDSSVTEGETAQTLKQLRSFALLDSTLNEEEGEVAPINSTTAGQPPAAVTLSSHEDPVIIDLTHTLSPGAPAAHAGQPIQGTNTLVQGPAQQQMPQTPSCSDGQQASAARWWHSEGDPGTSLSRRKLRGEYHERLKYSGGVFNMEALNVFGVYIGFDQSKGRHLEVWADMDCLLYCWPMSAMEDMATRCSPSLAAYWRNFITYSLASEFELLAHRGTAKYRCSTGESEHEAYLQGGRSRDFTDALRPDEQPEGFSWTGLRVWLKRALSPFPPKGVRHTALPTSGVMARNRVLAVAAERAHAAAARDAPEVPVGSRKYFSYSSQQTCQVHNDAALEPLLAKLSMA